MLGIGQPQAHNGLHCGCELMNDMGFIIDQHLTMSRAVAGFGMNEAELNAMIL